VASNPFESTHTTHRAWQLVAKNARESTMDTMAFVPAIRCVPAMRCIFMGDQFLIFEEIWIWEGNSDSVPQGSIRMIGLDAVHPWKFACQPQLSPHQL
jgi:hypothetical protein